MLNSISWQQYVTAVTLLSAAWYAYAGLRYYRPEIWAFLRITPRTASVLPKVAGAYTVMGAAQPEPGMGLAQPDELVFGAVSPDDISEATLPRGPADDLLAEAEILISAFADNDDKAGFLLLLRVLFSKYEVFAEEISLPNLIAALPANQLPFTIQASEWPLTFES